MAEDLSLDGLPEDTQEYIRKLRKEAAGYRTERNEFRDKYDQAGDLLKQANDKLDGFSALEDQLEKTRNEKISFEENYDRLRAAAEFGIPDEADRLKGKNYDEWKADAENLSQKFGGKKSTLTKDPAAGKTPKGEQDDPITAAWRKSGLL